MKSNEVFGSKTLGSQYQCQCCQHYGFPYLRNQPNKEEVKVNPSHEIDVDKKRKENSPELVLGNDQHLGSTTLSHLALIPNQMNPNCKELEASQAKTTSYGVCIDGWMITYKEFQPQKTKQAKRKCYHCQQEGHYIKSCPQNNQQLYHGSSQSQITIGLPPASVSDTQHEGSP